MVSIRFGFYKLYFEKFEKKRKRRIFKGSDDILSALDLSQASSLLSVVAVSIG